MKRHRRVDRRDRDTMRAEYDFSKGKRGVTAARYAEGTNVVVIDPAVLDVFPMEPPSTRPFERSPQSSDNGEAGARLTRRCSGRPAEPAAADRQSR
jgi:hypothetical protein